MSLVPHLLHAMVAADGEAVVIHTGDLPYIAKAGGEAEIGVESLTFTDVEAVLEQLLPAASLATFNRLGAIRYGCPPLTDYPGQRFTVVAYREADELWVEIRRDRSSAQERFADPLDPEAAEELNIPALESAAVAVQAADVGDESDDALALPPFDDLWPSQTHAQTIHSSDWRDDDAVESPRADQASKSAAPSRREVATTPSEQVPRPQPPPAPRPDEAPAVSGGSPNDLDAFDLDRLDHELAPPSYTLPAPQHRAPRPVEGRPIVTQAAPPPTDGPAPTARAVLPRQGVILPMSRNVRNDSLEAPVDLTSSGLVHLLRTVAARGGSALYIASGAHPSMRIDGEMQTLEDVEPLSAVDVETLLLGEMPGRTHEALRSGERTEWISEVPDLGRVRCVSFWDHRGAGGLFRILSARVVTAEELGLTREVQALALQPEGLVLIAGPRSSGKSTLISAFVDLINRTRRDHIITIENEIQVVHESCGSMISQREVRGEGQGLLAAISGALREDPDVLAIEELSGDGIMPIALEAAGSGRLVIGGLPAHSAADAVDRVFDRFAQGRQVHAQLALAESLRGIVVQTLLRKPVGGRVAARELLLNTQAVASLIAAGRTSQLPLAIEAGRKVGMMSLNDSIVALVKSGAVDVSEAYRRAADRQGLLALMKRHGIDTSPVERLA